MAKRKQARELRQDLAVLFEADHMGAIDRKEALPEGVTFDQRLMLGLIHVLTELSQALFLALRAGSSRG